MTDFVFHPLLSLLEGFRGLYHCVGVSPFFFTKLEAKLLQSGSRK